MKNRRIASKMEKKSEFPIKKARKFNILKKKQLAVNGHQHHGEPLVVDWKK